MDSTDGFSNSFGFVLTHFGVLFVLFIVILAAIWLRRGKKIRDEFPERKAGYRKILKWFVVLTATPFLFMELTILIGARNSVLDFLNVRSYGAIEWIFFGLIFTQGLLLNYWIFIKNGASYLARHPGLYKSLDEDRNSKHFKRDALLTPIAHIGFLVIGYSNSQYMFP